ncbi:hypothetical protein GCM10027051_33820 [Niabella terrae]
MTGTVSQGFYNAKQHIEKYMDWYNCRRKHGAIGFMTPMQKWAQGLSRKAVKALMKQGATGLSRPDCVSLSAASALYSLDKTGEPSYLCPEGDRGNGELVANHFEKSVQFIGG